MEDNDFFKQINCPLKQGYSLIIDDNGSVAYAYLLYDEDILSEVWLYNREPSPYKNWKDIKQEDLPPQNIEKYVTESIIPISFEYSIEDNWDIDSEGMVQVNISINEKLVAILNERHKIGSSTMVTEDTPIALKF